MFGGFSFGWLFEGTSTRAAVPWPRKVETMCWINELPLERTGLVLQRPGAWLDGLARALPETERVPGRTGGPYATLPATPPRDVTLEGYLIDVPMETLQAQLAALEDFLSGLLELRWPHAPGYVQRGLAGPLVVTPFNPDKAFHRPDAQTWRVQVTIRCSDNAVYARHPRRVPLSTTPAIVRTGGLGAGGEILLNGALSGSVNLDLISLAGVRVWRLALRNVSLGTGDVCRIRLDAPHLITKHTAAGVVTDVYRWRSLAESSRWQQASPRHADRSRGQHLRAVLSAGAGWWTFVPAEAA